MMQHPEVTQYEEEVRKGRRALLEGFVNFVFSCLVYSLFVWFITKILESADVISFRFTWLQSSAIVSSCLFVRVWDRALFKR